MKRIFLISLIGVTVAGCGGGEGRYQIVATSSSMPGVFRVDTQSGEVIYALGGVGSGSKPALVVPAGPAKQ